VPKIGNMALEIAAIIDECVLNPAWAETSCYILNSSLSKIKVGRDYSVLVTIAERSYLLASDSKGTLSVAIVPKGPLATKIMARAQCRLTIDADALGHFEQQAEVLQMLATRKMRCDGDSSQLKKLEEELAPYVGSLREAVDAAGPGSHVIKAAIDEHNSQLDTQKLELAYYDEDAMQLAVPGQYYVDDQPLLMKVNSWLLFSATSTMTGNTGQSNYCAANSLLDATSFSMRTTNSTNFEALTIMWGAVGGLGMRWKAFASQDFLATAEVDILMTAEEARMILSFMVNGLAPEWAAAQKVEKHASIPTYLEAMLMMMGQPNTRNPDPWKWGKNKGKDKGKGGGLTVASDEVDFHSSRPSKHDDQLGEQCETGGDSWLFPGRRVRVCGLVASAEVNDVKGTLVEEVSPRTWHVRLDDGWGEKLLKVENMTQVHSSVVRPLPVTSSATTEAHVAGAPEAMCIAGSWDAWLPHDMEWDGECYSFKAMLTGIPAAHFGVNRGVAGAKPWKSGSFKKWAMGQLKGCYQIKVFVKDRKVKDVKWVAHSR